MRLLVINKYVPPEPAPTAALAGELASMLRDRGAEVAFLGAATEYRTNRHRGWRRWLREIILLLKLFVSALLTKRPDCIICLTDPPGVLALVALVAKIRRVKLLHWAMDVYPHTAVALGEIRGGGVIHALAQKAMALGYAECDLIACLDEDMQHTLHLENDGRAFVSQPWPLRGVIMPASADAPPSGRIRWMYSGNLGRAHEYETLLQAQRLLENAGQPFELIFQGGGNAWTAARERSAELGLQHCHWQSYASREELVPSLLQAHVLIATQREEVKGLLWPSKLALLKLLPRSIVWVGPQDGSIARGLDSHDGHHGVFAIGDSRRLAAWLGDHVGAFREISSATSSLEALKTACLSAAQDEGDKWWFHLSRILPPGEASGGALLSPPLSGKQA